MIKCLILLASNIALWWGVAALTWWLNQKYKEPTAEFRVAYMVSCWFIMALLFFVTMHQYIHYYVR